MSIQLGNLAAKDGNTLLGDPPNWTTYNDWFLGTDSTIDKETKAHYGYPFGKNGVVYLAALRTIASRASAQNATDISDAASAALDLAKQKDADKVKAAARDLVLKSAADCDAGFEIVCDMKIAAAAPARWNDCPAPDPDFFEMDAYNGGPMKAQRMEYPVVADLEGMAPVEKSRPVLRDHDPSEELGHTTEIINDGKTLGAKGLISGVGPHVARVVDAAKNAFPWQASIGASVMKNQFVPAGRSAQANGQTFQGPINIARAWKLGEISVLTLGADDSTSTRIAAKTAERTSTMKFKAWMKARGLTAASMDEEAMKCWQGAFQSPSERRRPR